MESELDLPYFTEEEIQERAIGIQKGLDYARRNQQLELLYSQVGKRAAILRIITDEIGSSEHFLTFYPRGSRVLTLEEALQPDTPKGFNDPNKPWEVLLKSKEVSLIEVIKQLPELISDFYEEVSSLPITVYSHKTRWRKYQPMARLEPDNSFTIFLPRPKITKSKSADTPSLNS